MALKIVYENKESAGPKIKVDRRLYKNAEGKLVEEGDPSASALYCSSGKHVSRADFEERGGVVDVLESAPEPEPEPVKPEPKKKPAPKKAAPKSKKKES